MIVEKSSSAFALALTVCILLLGCRTTNIGGVSPIPTSNSPKAPNVEPTLPLPSPTLPLAPTSFLSIDTPATTITETFATAMIAMLPHSGTLLYAPISWYPTEFQLVETTVDPNLDWEVNNVANRGETLRAFVACNSDLCHGRLFVENFSTGQIFEIQFPGYMPWRPITHMNWLDDQVLIFTHPPQPSYGYRYAVDVSEQKLLLVIIVTNECFVYEKCD